jgi:protein-S-isoprenylcysteine O-methyltransferase Ste14
MKSKTSETIKAFFGTLGFLFIYFLVMFGIINIMVLAFEEPHLEKRFGDSYKRYRKLVHRWIPRLTPYQENDNVSV